ncbi:substrate-binding domain-containing protein [Leptolyngbya sp. BL0902]|uniref:substrate-binding domain-containing protein n=1 Tax=Leptolyngbya sp. BL0902 TaxID=1115757 RepID=UPI0018E8F2AC|nr:DUF4912 domain-containing protein [Leptolyngbya sp. BL0902]
MAPLRSTLAALTTLALGTTVLSRDLAPVVGGAVALAEASGTLESLSGTLESPVFPIPAQIPADARLTLDGSSSMAVSNEVFQRRLLERYPGLMVQIATSGTDVALDRLRRGEVDVVAMGRRLTPAEQAQGLVEVPIRREKIALMVGPENPLNGGITLDQLAQMFYGEIDNWAALGGPDLPLRFVDRPAASDTRLALGDYPALADRGLNPGPTVVTVAEDSTEAVIAALGNDGIGYAVVSQVQGREDVRLLTVDDVLPTDGRYPYSQPRTYVYDGRNPSPVALAFLGIVTAPDNLIPASVPPPSGDLALADPAQAADNDTSVRPWGRDGQAWGWLLAIPLLGGLLWWLLKHQGRQAVLTAAGKPTEIRGRIILTPRHCRRAYAYWEVPDELRAQQRERGGRTLRLRLLDVTDRDVERHPPARIDSFPVGEDQQDLHLPIPTDNHDYQVELGYVSQEDHWLPLVKSDPVRVPACAASPSEVERPPQALGLAVPPQPGT